MSDFKPLSPKQVGAIITAYCGVLCGDFEIFHAYAEALLGRSCEVHELGNESIKAQLKKLSTADFVGLHRWAGGK